MRLKLFDKEKEIKKKKKLILLIPCGLALMFLIIAIYQSFAIYKLKSENTIVNTTVGVFSSADIKIIGIYIDGESKPALTSFPTDPSLIFEKVMCKEGQGEEYQLSGATYTIAEGLTISLVGITDKIECSLHFTAPLYKKIITDNNNGIDEVPDYNLAAVDKVTYDNLQEDLKPGDVAGNPFSSWSAKESFSTTTGLYITSPTAHNISTDNIGVLYNSTNDNGGKSYYFRGGVKNNFVKFGVDKDTGNPMYWRIIRINSDNSIRLIYSGTGTSPAITGTGTQIGGTTYHFNYAASGSRYAAHVGLTFGPNPSSVAPTDYKTVHDGNNYLTGTQSSKPESMITVLNNWYEGTFVNNTQAGGTDAAARIATNQIFCGDRNLLSGTGVTGATSIYAAFRRLRTTGAKYAPTLQCINKTEPNPMAEMDQYGTNGTGNGYLTYPVGLITADEVSLAGGVYNVNNAGYWLFTGQTYWTMTPFDSEDNRARVFTVVTEGYLNNASTTSPHGVRPVINLKSDTTYTLASQTDPGTATNPYIVKIN